MDWLHYVLAYLAWSGFAHALSEGNYWGRSFRQDLSNAAGASLFTGVVFPLTALALLWQMASEALAAWVRK